jgi:hypothetical protein
MAARSSAAARARSQLSDGDSVRRLARLDGPTDCFSRSCAELRRERAGSPSAAITRPENPARSDRSPVADCQGHPRHAGNWHSRGRATSRVRTLAPVRAAAARKGEAQARRLGSHHRRSEPRPVPTCRACCCHAEPGARIAQLVVGVPAVDVVGLGGLATSARGDVGSDRSALSAAVRIAQQLVRDPASRIG